MTLREAIDVLVNKESLGDWIYDIRERVFEDNDFQGNSWDHPRVIRFSEAVNALEQYLNNTEE